VPATLSLRPTGAEAPAPKLCPNRSSFAMHPKLVDLLDFWHRKRAGRRMPARGDFDVFELRPWLGYLHLVEVIEGGEDFLHRIYGSEVAAAFGIDLTGKRLIAVPAAVRESVRRSYAAACESCEPLFIEDDPLLNSSVDRVQALIMPLSADGLVVDRLLIGTALVKRPRETEAGPPERRRAARIAVLASGMLHTGEAWENCVVLDYSLLGARLQLDRPMVQTGPVTMAFGDFPRLSGRIAWQSGRCAGIEFAEALTPGVA
jgi:hypothetical protein